MEFKEGFIKQMRELLGEETDAFFAAMQRPPVVAVRLNSRKPSDAFAGDRSVKWCATGRYLAERPVFTLDPLLHAGAYYVQDPSSMIYREVVCRILEKLGNPESVSVLDTCAAPGGKTTAMIDALPDGSAVVVQLAGCTIMGIGIAFEVKCGSVTMPGEGISIAISQVTGMSFPKVKIRVDTAIVVVATAASYLFFHHWLWNVVGIGTLFAMVYVGMVVKFVNPRIAWFDRLLHYIPGFRRYIFGLLRFLKPDKN